MNEEQKEFFDKIKLAYDKGDKKAFYDILIDEVGFLIYKNKLALIRTVKNSGADIDDNISDFELAKIVSNGIINQNEKFIENLARLIVEQKATYSNIAGLTQLFGYMSKGITAIGKGIAKAVEGKKQRKAEKATAEIEEKKANVELANKLIAASQEKKLAELQERTNAELKLIEANRRKKIIFIVGAVLGIGVISFIAYKVINKNA